ncbi:MAG: DinB family protein [Dehalococcoidia bacterium]
MAEDRDALLRYYRQMRADLLAAIDGLSDETMTEPSLDGWSVKDHLVHLSLWDEIRAAEIARISAGYDSAWRMVRGHEETYNDLGYTLRRDLTPEQARWELATTGQRVQDAIASATARGLDGSLYGEAGLRSTHEAEHTEWITRWRGERGR